MSYGFTLAVFFLCTHTAMINDRSAGEKKETIDYIWYASSGQLQLCGRLVLPSEADIGQDALPLSSIPSDHLPLLCEFQWVEQ